MPSANARGARSPDHPRRPSGSLGSRWKRRTRCAHGVGGDDLIPILRDGLRNLWRRTRPKQSRKRGDVATAGRNLASVTLTRLVALVLSMVITIVLARSLGSKPYGLYAFAYAFPSFILLLLSMGMDSVVTIEVARDRSRASDYLTAVSLLRVPLAAICVLLIWALLQPLGLDRSAQAVVLLIGVASTISTYALTFQTIFQAFEEFQYVTLVVLVERVFTTAGVILLASLGFDLLPIAAVIVIGSLLSLGVSLVVVKRRFAWFKSNPDPKLMRFVFWKSLPFGLASLTGTVRYNAATVLLTLLAGVRPAGYYNSAFALAMTVLVPVSLYKTAFLPLVTRFLTEKKDMVPVVLEKSQKFYFALGLPIALGGVLYADSIVTLLYGAEFLPAGIDFAILVLVALVWTATIGIGTALSASDHQTLNFLIDLFGTAVFVIACAVLIPRIQDVGAAVAFLLSAVAMAAAGVYFVNKLVARMRTLRVVWRPLLSGVAMVALLLTLRGFGIANMWLGIAVGAVSYFSVLVAVQGFSREDWTLLRGAIKGALFP